MVARDVRRRKTSDAFVRRSLGLPIRARLVDFRKVEAAQKQRRLWLVVFIFVFSKASNA